MEVNDARSTYQSFAGSYYAPANCPQSGNSAAGHTNSLCNPERLRGLPHCRGAPGSWPCRCGFNIPAVGKQVAGAIATTSCSAQVLDNSPGTDTPVQIDCTRPPDAACAQSRYNSKFNLPIPLLSFKADPDAAYSANMSRVNGIVWLVSHGLDPHGKALTPESTRRTPASS